MSTATPTVEGRAENGQTVLRDILEYSASGTAHRIDRGRGLIHDVKILGFRSRNGGVYPVSAMAAAKPLYEGARVNIDHPDRSSPDSERAFEDWFGVLENVRQLADGLYGDLAYLTSHPLAGQICEAAERFPGSFGLSHNAQVREGTQEGRVVYEAIHRVRSVDIVCKPATTRGIFESENLNMSANTISNVMCDAALSAAPADGISQRPAGDGQPLPQEPALRWEAFASRLRQLYDGTGQRATRALQAMQLVNNAFLGDGALDDPTHDAGGPVRQRAAVDPADQGWPAGGGLESVTAAESVPATQRGLSNAREQARNALESVGLAPDSSRINALAALTSQADRQALVRVWLASVGAPPAWAGKPRSNLTGAPEIGASAAQPTGAARWADPKVAAMAILSR